MAFTERMLERGKEMNLECHETISKMLPEISTDASYDEVRIAWIFTKLAELEDQLSRKVNKTLPLGRRPFKPVTRKSK